jgi:di/tricarboxylate transporter
MTDEFDMEDHLSRVVVREDSPIVGLSLDEVIDEVEADSDLDVDLLRLERDDESIFAAESDVVVEPGDSLLLRSSLQDLNRLSETYGFRQLPREEVEDDDLIGDRGPLIEAIVLPESGLVGETVAEAMLEDALDTTVLAIRRAERIIRTDLEETLVRPGDTVLLQTTESAIDYLVDRGDLVVTHDPEAELPDAQTSDEELAPISPKTPIAMGIMAAVIGAAALGLVPIVIAALGGVFAMVVTGCISASDAYDAVSWNIIFLLAGVLPLGVAMQRTGGDAVIASLLVGSADVLPIIAVLGLFYILTGLLANIITPVASVVLMIPIAVDTASRLGANGFAFLLAVTFAGSSAFMTPIGYQTNLMVYGPGGYKFTDYLRVGGPLQMLLAVVVTLGITVLFGLGM